MNIITVCNRNQLITKMPSMISVKEDTYLYCRMYTVYYIQFYDHYHNLQLDFGCKIWNVNK